METTKIYNWRNLPKKDIENIFNYIPFYYRPALRLLNKHWDFAISCLIFKTFPIDDEGRASYIINKYGNNFKFLNNNEISRRILLRNNIYEFGELEGLNWNLDKDEDLETLLHVLKISNNIKFIKVNEQEDYNPFIIKIIKKWGVLISYLIDYPSLEGLYINVEFDHLLPIFNSLPLLSIKKLVLKLAYNKLNQCIEVLKASKTIKSLSLEIERNENVGDNSDLTTLVSTNGPLSSRLEHLELVMFEKFTHEVDSIKNNLVNITLGIFSNQSLTGLKSLNFQMGLGGIDPNIELFSGSSAILTSKFLNLTKLNLTAIDTYLMSHISKYCPNLKELAFDSSLVLPIDKDLISANPLKYLTKLSFSGLQADLINQSQEVSHFFPNVVTLSLHKAFKQSNSIIMDTYYIAKLFPNLARLILAVEDYKLNKLVNEWEEKLNWVELYISISSSNLHFLNPLLRKLPRLSILYINHGYLSSKLDRSNLRPTKAKIFSVGPCDKMSFSFNINKRLNI